MKACMVHGLRLRTWQSTLGVRPDCCLFSIGFCRLLGLRGVVSISGMAVLSFAVTGSGAVSSSESLLIILTETSQPVYRVEGALELKVRWTFFIAEAHMLASSLRTALLRNSNVVDTAGSSAVLSSAGCRHAVLRLLAAPDAERNLRPKLQPDQTHR